MEVAHLYSSLHNLRDLFKSILNKLCINMSHTMFSTTSIALDQHIFTFIYTMSSRISEKTIIVATKSLAITKGERYHWPQSCCHFSLISWHTTTHCTDNKIIKFKSNLESGIFPVMVRVGHVLAGHMFWSPHSHQETIHHVWVHNRTKYTHSLVHITLC